MTDHHHFLSADMLFPDCPSCGSNLLVTRSPGCNTQFRCVPCEKTFNPEPESQWFGLDVIPEGHARDYIAVEIRGIPLSDQASRAGVSRETVKSNVNDARQRLRTMRAEAYGHSTDSETGAEVNA